MGRRKPTGKILEQYVACSETLPSIGTTLKPLGANACSQGPWLTLRTKSNSRNGAQTSPSNNISFAKTFQEWAFPTLASILWGYLRKFPQDLLLDCRTRNEALWSDELLTLGYPIAVRKPNKLQQVTHNFEPRRIPIL